MDPRKLARPAGLEPATLGLEGGFARPIEVNGRCLKLVDLCRSVWGDAPSFCRSVWNHEALAATESSTRRVRLTHQVWSAPLSRCLPPCPSLASVRKAKVNAN